MIIIYIIFHHSLIYFRYERLNDSEEKSESLKISQPNAFKQCSKHVNFCYCQECIGVDPDLNPEKLKNLSMIKKVIFHIKTFFSDSDGNLKILIITAVFMILVYWVKVLKAEDDCRKVL